MLSIQDGTNYFSLRSGVYLVQMMLRYWFELDAQHHIGKVDSED